jgi:hypothetical protein
VETQKSIPAPIRLTCRFPNVYGMETILIALAAVCFAIYRQMRATPIRADRAFILPVAFFAIGVAQGGLTGSSSVALLVTEILTAVVSGVVRGATVRIWRDASGVLWRQGTIWTVAAWIASIAARIALVLLGQPAAPHAISTGALLIFLGVSLAAQAAYVAYRSASPSERAKVQV